MASLRMKARIRMRSSGLMSRAMLLALLCGPVLSAAIYADTHPAKSNSPADLGSEGQAALRTAISGGSFPDLRWPDFSDYREHVKKFYEFSGDSLWWMKGMEPNPAGASVDRDLASSRSQGTLGGRL